MSRKRGGPIERALSVDDVAYLDGLLDAFADFSDGAWQSACVDAIEASGRFKRRDPFDVWLAYCFAKSEQAKAKEEPVK